MCEDDVVFARLSEESDYRWNQTKSDRLAVVGLKSTEYPTGLSERKEFLSGRLRPLIEDVVGEVVFDVYPKLSGLQNERVPPFILRFPNAKDCDKFKRDGCKSSLSFPDIKGAGFQPCVTPATRVRIEILRAIARKIVGDQAGYCPIYAMRPVLHVGPRVDGRVQAKESLTFGPAVQKYGNLLHASDLSFAYKSVGESFKGCLRQTFVVLNEHDREAYKVEQKRLAQQSRGTKRPNSDTVADGGRSKTKK